MSFYKFLRYLTLYTNNYKKEVNKMKISSPILIFIFELLKISFFLASMVFFVYIIILLVSIGKKAYTALNIYIEKNKNNLGS